MTYTSMLTNKAALLVIAPNWEQPKNPPTGEQITNHSAFADWGSWLATRRDVLLTLWKKYQKLYVSEKSFGYRYQLGAG